MYIYNLSSNTIVLLLQKIADFPTQELLEDNSDVLIYREVKHESRTSERNTNFHDRGMDYETNERKVENASKSENIKHQEWHQRRQVCIELNTLLIS